MGIRMSTANLSIGDGLAYLSLSRETAEKVQAATVRIRERMKRTVEDVIQIGRDLIKVKAVLGHGVFGKWLKTELGWSHKTSERFVSVAETFGPIFDNLSILPLQPSAAYVLAAPSVPVEARQMAITRAQAGETITHNIARALIAEFRDKKTPASDDKQLKRLAQQLDSCKKKFDAAQRAALARLLRQVLCTIEDAESA
jgi:hypothetical protein